MARPLKQGIDYFSMDVDFYENLKVRKILRSCGPSAGSVLTCLLCNIYRNKGYYILWDEDLPFDIADKVGMSEGAVTEVIKKALQVEFFNPDQYEKNRILTSEEIQKRYRVVARTRTENSLNESYSVIDVKNSVIDVNNEVNDAGSTQSKVKYSKVKESVSAREGGSGGDLAGSNLFRKPVIPTKKQVWEAFVNAGGDRPVALLKQMAASFYSKHEGTGWYLNGSPVVNYTALIQRFIQNWDSRETSGQKTESNESRAKSEQAAKAIEEIRRGS